MDKQGNKIFNWVVVQGNIVLFMDNDKIHLEINKDNHPACLLTRADAEEVIDILSDVSEEIWNQPGYVKEPYTGKLYKQDESGKVYWDISESRVFIGLNEGQDLLEIDVKGGPVVKLPLNVSVEIIQVMTHFLNRLN